jgi:hypothetical protein
MEKAGFDAPSRAQRCARDRPRAPPFHGRSKHEGSETGHAHNPSPFGDYANIAMGKASPDAQSRA